MRSQRKIRKENVEEGIPHNGHSKRSETAQPLVDEWKNEDLCNHLEETLAGENQSNGFGGQAKPTNKFEW